MYTLFIFIIIVCIQIGVLRLYEFARVSYYLQLY